MKQLFGKPVSRGYAEGRAFLANVVFEKSIVPSSIEGDRVKEEIERFDRAVKGTCRELENLRDRVLADLGDAESCIFDSHLTLLNDPEFIQKIKDRVYEDRVRVDDAIVEQVNSLKGLLENVESEFLRERTQDIQDVGNRLLKNLRYPHRGRFSLLRQLPPQSVLVAKELFPSDAIELDRANTIAIVTERGGTTSHAAILARSLGIPFITGIKDLTKHVAAGDWLLVNAQEGIVTVDPQKNQSEDFSYQKTQYTKVFESEVREEVRECRTIDGVTIELFGNIDRLEEMDLIQRHYLKGVGLFRTEYLFMETDGPPTLEQQRAFYQRVIQTMGNLPVTIRTLDLGGDKTPLFINRSFELSPHMGSRGLRFSLLERGLFDTQIRAILTSGPLDHLRVMFPMVLGFEDLREAIEIVTRIAHEERIKQLPKIGAMVETPSSIFQIEEILELADFVSIGTNDLLQFMFAADRNYVDPTDGISPFHPSMIKAIYRVASEAKKRGKAVSVCGESAGDPRTAGLFVGLGIDQLSMSPIRAAHVGHFLRSQSYKDLKRSAMESLKCKSFQEVKAFSLGPDPGH